MNRLEQVAKEWSKKEKRTEPHDPIITQPYSTTTPTEKVETTPTIEPPTKPLTESTTKSESKRKLKQQTLYVDEVSYNTLQILCKKKKLKINNIVNELIENYLKANDPNGTYRTKAIEISKMINE